MADHQTQTAPRLALTPLPYQDDVVAYLQDHEPDVWRWACSAEARAEHADAVRTQLLQQTYRLAATAHPDLHARCQAACARLGLTIPVTLYQAGDGAMNAALFFVPGEAHIVFTGPVLERLHGAELEAVLGHELAHYVLWDANGGAYHAADRLLEATAADARASASQVQTARLFRLCTEAFADRGSVIACGDLAPAVSALVKTQTGLAEVHAQSYLQQADEICAGSVHSREATHPEIFVRARALRLWSESRPEAESWLHEALRGPLSIEALDIVAQQQAVRLTRRVLAQLLRRPFLRSEAMLAHMRRFFPDFQPDDAYDAQLAADLAAQPGMHGYVVALMLDMATADRDLDDVPLAAALQDASQWALADAFERRAMKDLRMPKRQFQKARQAAEALLARAEGRHV